MYACTIRHAGCLSCLCRANMTTCCVYPSIVEIPKRLHKHYTPSQSFEYSCALASAIFCCSCCCCCCCPYDCFLRLSWSRLAGTICISTDSCYSRHHMVVSPGGLSLFPFGPLELEFCTFEFLNFLFFAFSVSPTVRPRTRASQGVR